MVVETRYVAGGGVLLGSGDHWLLVTDPGDEAVVERLWSALGEGTDTSARVLDVVEDAFGGEPPALVLVDLTPGTGQTVSLGSGRVRVEGPARLISIGEAGQGDEAPLRRFLGGVVAARRAEIRPLAPPVAATPTRSAAPAPLADGLIDGIPRSILDARGPDGPPPPRERRLRPVTSSDSGPRETSEPDPEVMARIVGASADVSASGPAAPEPADGPADDAAAGPAAGSPAPDSDHTGHRTGHRTGSLAGLGEPTGVTGSLTGNRAPATTGASGESAPRGDHDGSTVYRSSVPEHLTSTSGSTVQAVWCPDGHITPPDSPLCRVCRKQVAPQAAQRVPRPTLGGLRLPTGEVVPLDRGVVLGRRPAPVPGSGDWPHLVHLSPEHTYVSRLHVQIEIDGWLVIARDLGSRGGTTWKVPGQAPERMVPDESYVLEPGHALDLADVYEVRYVVGPEVTL